MRRYRGMQDMTRLKVDELIFDVRIEQLWKYIKEGGAVMKQWCSGVVVAAKTQIEF